jgi:hypothetical protein
MRVGRAAIILVAVGALVGAASAFGATPAASPSGGTVRVFADPGNGTIGTIVITGAIADYGKTLSMDKNGKPNPNGNFVRFTLKHGTFEGDVTTFNKQTATAPGTFTVATCSFSFAGTGPVTLFNGTGRYKGISGRVTVTVNFAGISGRYTSGKNKGKCIKSDKVQPLAEYGSIIGKGTVKFG